MFYLCQNLIFMSSLILKVGFYLANVSSRVCEWLVTTFLTRFLLVVRLQAVSCSLLVSDLVGCFRLFLARCRSFLVCCKSLQVVVGCFKFFLLVVGHFRSFQVIPIHFQLAVDRFRSFLARCRSFQVVPRFSKYLMNLVFTQICNMKMKIKFKQLMKKAFMRAKNREEFSPLASKAISLQVTTCSIKTRANTKASPPR